MINIFSKSTIGNLKSDPIELKLSETIDLFNAAYEAYKILTCPDKNTESFHKDWSHLEKRWKVHTWIWHRLFLIDKLIKDNAFDSAITSLSNIIKQPNFPKRLAVRCKAQLGCCYYGMKKIRASVRPLVECLALLYSENKAHDRQMIDDDIILARNSQINWIKAKISHLLPYTVHVVLQGLEEIIISLEESKHRK